MSHCHRRSISLLQKFMDGLNHLGTKRVLEVAAGDGQVARDLLKSIFSEIDCFDQCPIAVRKLEILQQSI